MPRIGGHRAHEPCRLACQKVRTALTAVPVAETLTATLADGSFGLSRGDKKRARAIMFDLTDTGALETPKGIKKDFAVRETVPTSI